MTQGGALVKNTLIIAVGRLFTQFLTFLLLPLYTAFLSPSSFGELDLITLYIGLLAPTFTLQMEMSVFRHLIDARGFKNVVESRRIVSSAFCVAAMGAAIGSVVIAVVGAALGLPLTLYIVAVFISTVHLNFFLQVARGKGRNDLFAMASVVTGLANISMSVIALVVLHMSVNGILIASIIANSVGAILLIVKTDSLHDIKTKYIKKKIIMQLVGYSWPLVPNHFAIWGIGGVSRTVVAAVLGVAAVGIYAAANKFGLIYTALYSVFAMSWTEAVSLHFGKKGDFLSNASNGAIKLFGSLALLVVSFSAIVFPILVADDFAGARVYIPFLLSAAFFSSLMTHYGAIYLAAKETKRIVQITFQALAVSAVLTLVGIWFIGLWSAVLALLVTYVFIAVRRHVDIQRLAKISYKPFTYIQLGLLAIVVFTLYYINNNLLNIISVAVTIVTATIINKNEIKKITNVILNKGSA